LPEALVPLYLHPVGAQSGERRAIEPAWLAGQPARAAGPAGGGRLEEAATRSRRNSSSGSTEARRWRAPGATTACPPRQTIVVSRADVGVTQNHAARERLSRRSR
jgi:hypothetical protein